MGSLDGDRLPTHASERRTRRDVWLWSAVLGAGLLAVAGAFLGGSGTLLLIGPVLAVIAIRRLRRARSRLVAARAFVLAQHAQAAVEAGQFDEAERLLEALPPKSPEGALRGARLLSAVIALRRGDLVAAHALASQLITSRRARDALGGVQHATALGIRALALAGSGSEEGARADLEAVASSPYAFREARLFASLAWGVLLERGGERAALREHLDRNRAELLRGAGAHERRLIRAWSRMLELPTHSIYRAAPAAAPAAEPAFVRSLSPEAARFADEPARDASATERVLGEQPLEGTTTRRKPKRAWLALLGLPALAAMTWAIGRALWAGTEGVTHRARFSGDDLVAFGLFAVTVVGILGVVFLGTRRARARADAESLFQAFRWLGQGRIDEARRIAVAVAGSSHPHVAAQAELLLAQVALEDLSPERAHAHAERGLAKLKTPAIRELVADTLLAELVTAQAYALAALDRPEAARDALSELPASAFALRQRFGVELLVAVRGGDDARARELAAAAPPNLGALDDLLVDLVRAISGRGGVGLAELLRLRRDVSRPGERRFLRAYAPSLLEAFDHLDEVDAPTPALDGVRVVDGAPNDEATDVEAELDAVAEEEASPRGPSGRRVA